MVPVPASQEPPLPGPSWDFWYGPNLDASSDHNSARLLAASIALGNALAALRWARDPSAFADHSDRTMGYSCR